LETAVMKFLRALWGLTRLDHQRYTTTQEKLKVRTHSIWNSELPKELAATF
jgi:hypothetical protein